MKYRIHFDIEIEQSRSLKAWENTVLFLRKIGLLPEEMYETGNSKKEAMSRPVDFSSSSRIGNELARVLSKEAWDEFIVSCAVWAPGEKERVSQLVFGVGTRAGKPRTYLFVKFPSEVQSKFESAIPQLREMIGDEIVVCRFRGTTPKVEAVWDREHSWVELPEAKEIAEKIMERTGFWLSVAD